MSESIAAAPASSSQAAASGSGWTQDGRLIAVSTPLGKDRLLLTSLVGEEAISQLFAYEIEMLSLDHAISAESLIGRSVTMTITSEAAKQRAIHGLVAQLRIGPVVGRDLRLYSARIVPWLWYLQHTTDCRIFQHLSIPEIIEQVFGTYGFTDFEISVSRGDYQKLDFCVQYRESAFHFISRLMEEVGMFYFFRHEDDRHVLVIADKNVSFRPLPDPQLIYAPGNLQSGHITRWEHCYDFRPGRWSQKDFNFEKPSLDLSTTEKTVLKLRNAQTIERFDYPGRYFDKDLGGKLTRTLMEAEEAAHHAVQGSGNYPCLDAGGKFTLASHPCEDSKTAYVVRRVRHDAVEPSYLNQDEPSRYENSFQAIPHDVPFKPLRVTERPFVHGPQTAIVVGPPGEKIFTDKHGRVRVQFHWDRYGKHDDKSSCWIRVSHAWAGRGWGDVNLPHVGHEVIVSFLEGDPDRPLVTGRVYNGENMTAMGMPDNKTQSAIRDHSGNEIVMEGKSGSEDIRVNATKDTNVVITHDYNETVKTGNRKIDVQSGTHTETIKGDTTIRVLSGKLVHRVESKTADYFVSGNVTEVFDNQQVTKVSNAISIYSLKSTISLQAAEEIRLTSGASQMTLHKDGTIKIIGNNISIVGNEGVTIGGKKIGVQGGDETKIGVGGQNTCYDKAKVTTSGAGIAANAAGQHDITGAIVKIN
jgi:type VI secretion system secreted protein VgrG